MGLAGFKILGELFQMFNAKWNYFHWENLIEWITYSFAFLLVVDVNSCEQETGLRTPWQWQMGAIAIFLAWLNLVLFIRKVPRFGIYVVMFTDVLYTFVQFFPVFFLFIVAFALAFFALLQNQIEFANMGMAMTKTLVMMIGEFEFGDIFLSDTDNELNDEINLKPASYIIFIIFVFVMTVIIMNLLVGLAVDDIKAVQEQAVLKRLAMQVELALDVEAVSPEFFRKRNFKRVETIKPNVKRNAVARFFTESSALSAQAITKALDPELDEFERLEENQDKMKSDISLLRYRMRGVSERTEKLESMMCALLKHHNVDWEEEDSSQPT